MERDESSEWRGRRSKTIGISSYQKVCWSIARVSVALQLQLGDCAWQERTKNKNEDKEEGRRKRIKKSIKISRKKMVI